MISGLTSVLDESVSAVYAQFDTKFNDKYYVYNLVYDLKTLRHLLQTKLVML